MKISSRFRSVAVAVIAAAGISFASAAHADSGTIRFAVYKAAFFVGGSGGEGTLTFHGRRYPISIGGISGGLAFGASKTYFQWYRAPHSPRPRCDGGVRCSGRWWRGRQRGPDDRHDQ